MLGFKVLGPGGLKLRFNSSGDWGSGVYGFEGFRD